MITIHNIANFGSAFQAMALNRYLRQEGHDCRVIDYNPPYFTKGSLKQRLGKLLNYRAYRRRTKSYRTFVENNMKLTPSAYTSVEQLQKENWQEDLYIAGGDQLWNEFYPCGRDDAYKLAFTKGPKIAFGTSLGKSTFTAEGMRSLKEKVCCFQGIGIRESSGVKLLNEAGVSQACHVCDPVFLLSRQEYSSYLKEVEVKEPYVFVYLVDKSELLDAAIDFIQKELGLKIVLYTGFIPKCRYDVWIREQGPEETLSYIANAQFVLSASFHATAFSAIFHKQFFTILPGENTNARIEDFLELIGLPERKISAIAQLKEELLQAIDWAPIEKKLEEHIEQSKDYLRRQLER